MEGSMIRGVEVGSSAVQYCPLDQLTGAGHTMWTLTSADMLSFARQIALAMVRTTVSFNSVQFLPARRYASAANSYGPVSASVSVCVCHKSVFNRNG